MLDKEPWILVGTETNGAAEPICVIGLAAWKMQGWEAEGAPFRRLVNRNVDIPAQTTRLNGFNGYTRDMLERDGEPASQVHEAFRSYCGELPLVSWDLEFDLDRALIPEWERLGITAIGGRGFCVRHLAQRLLDPVPVSNCRLATLAEYYGLPEPPVDATPGALETVRAFLGTVLRPLARERGLDSFRQILRFAEEEWFPTILPLGKFRGRSFLEARHDRELRDWIEWLSDSRIERTARMGAWYLVRLAESGETGPERTAGMLNVPASIADAGMTDSASESGNDLGEPGSGISIYRNPELERVRELVRRARERLAELESVHAKEQNIVSTVKATLFSLLEGDYRERDRLALIVHYRKHFIDTLYTADEDSAEEVKEEFSRARENQEEEYREAREMAHSKKPLTDTEQAEIREIYRKLCRLYHPDRYASDPDKLHTYTKLTQEINTARDRGDIQTLREIANDPSAWLQKRGLGRLDFSEDSQLDGLLKVYRGLQVQIVLVLERISQLRSDPDYELARLSARRPGYLEEVAADYRKEIRRKCEELEREAEDLASQIEEMTGSPAAHWGV